MYDDIAHDTPWIEVEYRPGLLYHWLPCLHRPIYLEPLLLRDDNIYLGAVEVSIYVIDYILLFHVDVTIFSTPNLHYGLAELV